MSQRDGFTGGFLIGTIVGGVVGGIIGALAASRSGEDREVKETSEDFISLENENPEEKIESARRSLESKISQLNLAIDDVRQQLSSVNSNSIESE